MNSDRANFHNRQLFIITGDVDFSETLKYLDNYNFYKALVESNIL